MSNTSERCRPSDQEGDSPAINSAHGQTPSSFETIADIKKRPPMRWLIPDLLPECGIVLVYGEPGCGKSLFVQMLCESLLDRSRVLWIPTEGFSGLRGRFGHLPGDANIVFDRTIPKLAAVPQLAIKSKAEIVVLDTWADCLGGLDENDAGAMSLPVDTLREIARDRCVIVVHHSNKAGKDKAFPSLNACRGSSRLTGAVDVAIHVDNDKGVVRVAVAKNKDGAKPQFKYRIVPRGESVTLVEEETPNG